MVAYEGGFAVVYRSWEADETRRSIRLAFVHGSSGEVVASLVVAESAQEDGPPDVAVAGDGTLLITYASLTNRQTTIESARIVCPEAWLRCSERPEGDS